MDRDRPDAIFMVADALTTFNRKRVFDYAGAHHIPALYEYDVPNVHDGGLMSYGPDLKESMERAADLTARIFAGARPADLPFEEPTRYKLVINLKTAKATGIELPENFVALADDVCFGMTDFAVDLLICIVGRRGIFVRSPEQAA